MSEMSRGPTGVRFALLALVALVVVLAAGLLGPASPATVWAEIKSGDFNNPFWSIRLPRMGLSALVGAG
ncbi:MAG: hypothetical protein ABIG44_07745, partial [Planctomycetota bacterium]